MKEQLSLFETKEKNTPTVVNVASVPQRSPFRYPGGKTWLIPIVRKWLKQGNKPDLLFEPFAGGGIVSLTTAFENLADKVIMVELDNEVSAVWDVIINDDYKWLAETIFSFELTIENANKVLNKKNKNSRDQALSTIIKNRISHGGIIAKGSGLIKNGEKGKGIKSRWYPKTLRNRIVNIGLIREKIEFIHGDAFTELEKIVNKKNAFSFIDPPYTVAGRRLYTHFDINHDYLFELVSKIGGKYLLTYDDTAEIRSLSKKYNLDFRTIPMKTTHHIQKNEILISDNFNWL